VLLSPRFLGTSFEAFITAGEYFRFATQVMMAFGFVFQLPLVMVLLSAMGLVSPHFFSRNRPYAFVVGSIVAAFVTPPDVVSMVMMLAPIMVLYELGILIGKVIWKRRLKRTASIGGIGIILLALTLAGTVGNADAQQRGPPRPVSAQAGQDTSAVRDSARIETDSAGVPIDSAAALGLPTGPSRQFPSPDSIIQALLSRSGYRVTRYAADSIVFYATTREIDLIGSALLEREGAILEADSVNFQQERCVLLARGGPRLFEAGKVVVGETMDYDTCSHMGSVLEARTSFNQAGVDWFLDGALGIDSAATRMYAGHSGFTSCTESQPHYHFQTGQVKWVANNIMVARPAVLYIRDVPVMWLPFIFQDMRQGRRSGLLTPRIGFSDIIRPNREYRRQINNIGYYFALTDYLDLELSLDWFAETSVTMNSRFQYKWLNQFMDGSISLSRTFEPTRDGTSPGRRNTSIGWTHRQQFSEKTSLNALVNIATSSGVLRDNAVDPFFQTGRLRSQVNFQKQTRFGNLSIGATRSQELANEQVTLDLPNLSFTPVPIRIGGDITWSPNFAFNVNQTLNQAAGVVPLPPVDGLPQEDSLFADSRLTTLTFGTPIRFGSFNWSNSFSMSDVWSDKRTVQNGFFDAADTATTFSRVYGEEFSTQVDWNTGINLPTLFSSTWKVQPSLGITNSTSGPFMIRNEFTGGRFIQQGKRWQLRASASPTLFGFLPGLGPIARIRHTIAPQFGWDYAPPADVNLEFLRAMRPTDPNPQARSIARHTFGMNGLSNTFEGKFATPDDTTGQAEGRKIKLLSVQTTGFGYDFEQAQEPGQNGWTTQTVTNSFTSDLLRGFSLRTVHDLWDGPVGYDSTNFDVFLTSIAVSFNLT
ncbi:MAG: twin-arginine translocase subunit TatC, partial [Gemmatimonadota bacterium]|nr:twin-arginine translocase subunit TatC [Gemmatimonadota bacterium]